MHHIGLYGASLNKKEKYGGCMGEKKKKQNGSIPTISRSICLNLIGAKHFSITREHGPPSTTISLPQQLQPLFKSPLDQFSSFILKCKL